MMIFIAIGRRSQISLQDLKIHLILMIQFGQPKRNSVYTVISCLGLRISVLRFEKGMKKLRMCHLKLQTLLNFSVLVINY